MRVHFAIIFSLICGPALADGDVQFSTTIPAQSQPVSIGRPHVCTESYPVAAIAVHAQGTTTLSFTITSDGKVRDITVAKSSGNKDLDDAAVQCASQWQYRPAIKNLVPVEAPWKATVEWRLGEPPGVRIARYCLNFRDAQTELPKTIGVTSLSFRIHADGSITDAAVAHSSGDDSLDRAGVVCALSNHYDTSLLTLPPEGIAGHVDLEWSAAIASMPATFVRPKPLTSHTCSLRVGFMTKSQRPTKTILNYVVGLDGNVSDVQVAQSGGNDVLDNEARLCAQKWRYEPAQEGGHPVIVKWAAEVDWQAH